MSITPEYERNATRLLQAAIFSEPGILPQGYRDPGWCCTEHALVATLALRLCGVTAFLCSGELLIGRTDSANVPARVVPHDYVVIGSPPKGVFDSSISCDSIDGIPMCYAEMYPMLAVGLTNRPITVDDWRSESSRLRKTTFALYSATAHDAPSEKMVKWESTTPFGKWLSQQYGSQSGLWGKAAWLVAQCLSGHDRFDYSKHDKATIWDQIASSPDRDETLLS